MAGKRDKESDAFMVVGDALENSKYKTGNGSHNSVSYQKMLDSSKARAYTSGANKKGNSKKNSKKKTVNSADLAREGRPVMSKPPEKLTFREVPPDESAVSPASQKTVPYEPVSQKKRPVQPAQQRSGVKKPTGRKTVSQKTGTQRPVSQKTGTQRPVSQKTGTQRPVSQKTGTQRPVSQKTGAQRPVSQKTGAQRPAAQKPAAQRPANQRPAAQRPATQRPAAQRPAAPAPQAQNPETASAAISKTPATPATPAPVKTPKKQNKQKTPRVPGKVSKAFGKASTVINEKTGIDPSAIAGSGATAIAGAGASAQAALKSGGRSMIQLHQSMEGMSIPDRIRYLLSLIGPTYRSINADPIKKEKAYKVLVIVISLILAIHMTSCVNDILGFTRSDREKVITVEEGETTNHLIGKLDRAGLIKHSTMCKVFIASTSGIRGDKDIGYLKGDFTLTPDMGIEKMLVSCMATQKKETVQVTIPEGFTIEQIAEKLEEQKVCNRSDFLKAANKKTYDYDFVDNISNASARYHLLEGYMYPDTYEFYVGESGSSVVSKLLNNFNSKWTDAYEARAKQMNMSLDDVLTLASIVQKEDSNADNMKTIASVFYNRLNSSAYPSLQSDASTFYLENYVKPNVTSSQYTRFKSLYSTYECKGLPVGPICSPGDDAITAVLWPNSTNYYFFIHDDDGNLYAARTANEQNVNAYKAAQNGTKSSDE